MTQKTLLILGGSHYVLPVIDAAHQLGARAVTCDYLPQNTAHQYSDGYENVSIVDRDAVLEVARAIGADGVTSFATDPGVLTAAYVAGELGLAFQASYDAVHILQNKARFRAFLAEHGFNSPLAFAFGSSDAALAKASDLPFPVIVKPVDSAGSKGVTRVDHPHTLADAVDHALNNSISGECIIEEFIELSGCQIVAEGFTVDGKFKCLAFMDHYFDGSGINPYAPVGHTLPSVINEHHRTAISNELQRLSDILGLRSGIYNIEARVATNGTAYLMEVSPRAGGNRLAEFVRAASGVDLIQAEVQAALGMPITGMKNPEYRGVWHQEVLHSRTRGVFGGIQFADGFERDHVVAVNPSIRPGTQVEAFSAANHAFGTLWLRFESFAGLDSYLADKERYSRIVLDA